MAGYNIKFISDMRTKLTQDELFVLLCSYSNYMQKAWEDCWYDEQDATWKPLTLLEYANSEEFDNDPYTYL